MLDDPGSAANENKVAYDKPVPTPSELTKPFWDGARAGKLMLPRCTTCNRVHIPFWRIGEAR